MKSRVEGLDYLRGLMAFSIMIYHLVSWHYLRQDATTIIGRLGVYGVSIFFILSGLSMAIVYSHYFDELRKFWLFYIRRIFRIWPLLWLCIFAVTVIDILQGKNIDFIKLILNLTTLFGFISPNEYINTGAWSIGNEMVYYALTPLLMIAYNKSVKLGNTLLLISILIGLFFSFYLLNPLLTLRQQWHIYINPFNNLFLYIAGIAIYFNDGKIDFHKILTKYIVVLAIGLFAFMPAYGDRIILVTGTNRILFSIFSIFIVLYFYKGIQHECMPKAFRKSLEMIGLATYGIYLIHPIINRIITLIVDGLNFNVSTIFTIIIVILTTLFVAIAIYMVFERRFVQIGKQLTTH